MAEFDFLGEESTVRVMLDNQFYSCKPVNEMNFIAPRLKSADIAIDQLARKLSGGYSCRPGLLVGGCKAKNWTGQQCFFLDVDRESCMTVQTALKLSAREDIAPNIIYPSFRFTLSCQRFRMVFVVSEIIRDREVRDRIQKKLMDIFHCDRQTFTLERIFFGGNACFWVDCKARLDVKKFLGGNANELKNTGEH